MSFADIINAEQKKLEESQGGGDKVKYPETKNKRLFFEKGQREILVQILPAANLVSAFTEPVRKIFLTAKSSQGKVINTNFTLDAEPNEGSLLEQKIVEWSAKGMIPNGFGGQQSPKRMFLVNLVKVIQHPHNPQQWVQERDQQGNLVVRTFEMPQSAYSNLIRKLQDQLYNVSGSELSFMDPNRPSPVKISKPAKGQMEYPVEVYTSIILPPLGQGWEGQLENLKEQAVPTERLENGYQWVQAFVDMSEGRKPTRGGQDAAAPAQQPQANPYGANPYGAAPLPNANPYGGAAPIPNANPYGQQPASPAPQPNPYGAAPQADPYAANPYAVPIPNATPHQGVYAPPTQQPDYSEGIGTETDINSMMPTDMGQQSPPEVPGAQPPQYTPQAPPAQDPAPNMPSHNVGMNDNGLMNIDAMLEKELNGGM